MAVSKDRKAELIKQYGKDEKDSGSAQVQVALLTERIRQLTDHMKSHQKDFHTRRGLLMLVGKRRRLLSYIKANDIEEYRTLIASLGIRDNIQ
ncbi:30S ribosomal protein S15 [Lancefieldella parvula]|uniref:30S ribosomal protein S15 n=1 Tax=Lancefieldella parvula TaxID=1382 RepID=UPI00288A186B|nr:30S ribosomal protein S15 [Lancefieldella parvula]